MPVPVLGELWSGVLGSNNPDENRQRLQRGLSQLIIWQYSAEAAEHFGHIFMQLRRAGRPIQQIDIQIAAIAFSLGDSTVVSRDSDLSAVVGLRVENWSD
ncbi:MAG: type II toxin-antitoxin system VapC family toxin [Gemmataceae bacterium]